MIDSDVQLSYIFIDFSAFLIYQLLTGGVTSPTLIMDLPVLPPVIHHIYHISVPISLCLQQLLVQVKQISVTVWICLFIQILGWELFLQIQISKESRRVIDFQVIHLFLL